MRNYTWGKRHAWNTNSTKECGLKREVKRETWENKGKENWLPLEKRAEVPGGWCGRGVCGGGAGFVWRGEGSQRAVSCLVFGQNVLTAAEFLPQVGHFLSERPLLSSPGIPRGMAIWFSLAGERPGSVCCRSFLSSAPCPVSVVLCGDGERETNKKRVSIPLEFTLVTKFH